MCQLEDEMTDEELTLSNLSEFHSVMFTYSGVKHPINQYDIHSEQGPRVIPMKVTHLRAHLQVWHE
jgi:hypothetical protein